MTSAAGPTWAPAKGGTRILGRPSQKYSSKDLAAHTSLKPRRDGQETQDEVRKRDPRVQLEEREPKHFGSKHKSFSGTKRDGDDRLHAKHMDTDDSDVDVNNDDESDDDDDDTLADLEQIKRERAEEKARKERLEQEEELKTKEAEVMRGNPLMNFNSPTNFNVKTRWDDDAVFKNQARGETKLAKRFINDTTRNDFYRKFVDKYMK